jgi:hypothetical protein
MITGRDMSIVSVAIIVIGFMAQGKCCRKLKSSNSSLITGACLVTLSYFIDRCYKSGIGYALLVLLLSLRAKPFSFKDTLIVDFICVCYSSKESRKIGLFFLINFCFMFIELSYGILANSLGLITDSFHMLFDCMGLFLGLCASYIA